MTTPLGYRVVAYTTGTGALASWAPLEIMLGGFAVVVITLIVLGRAGNQHSRVGAGLQRVPNGLERVTGIPGWAAAAVGTSMFGLVVAGQGFYADVAWHVAYGRDKTLFTPPHTRGRLLGLFLATLELIKGRRVVVEQADRFGEIHIHPAPPPAPVDAGSATN